MKELVDMPRQAPWTPRHIRDCEARTGQAMLSDAATLARFGGDFGRLARACPAAVFAPSTPLALQQAIAYADENGLPVCIRAGGLSQGGQTLPVTGGLTILMDHFGKVDAPEEAEIWVDANASWSALLAATLPAARVPCVTPYNTNLSIAGLLSVGGVGAASFKHGVAAAHVNALEVVTANGDLQRVDAASPLFHACLGGMGHFGIITRAAVALRPCCSHVRTYTLVYADKAQWLSDLEVFQHRADFIETFCTPALLGTKAMANGRQPFAQWLFSMQVSFEHDGEAPELASLGLAINPWKIAHGQDETMQAYLLRHEPRFHAMKLTGQWDLQHPWYECLVPRDVMLAELDDLLRSLPLHFATVVHLVPIARRLPAGFFMTPDQPACFSVMVLHPGVPPALVPGCLEAVKAMDERFLPQGGKRYLSGFLGQQLSPGYWKTHFASRHEDWLGLKTRYDPKGTFRSSLHERADT